MSSSKCASCPEPIHYHHNRRPHENDVHKQPARRLSGVGPEFRQPLITTIISIDDLMKMMSISRQPGSQASVANLSAALPACPAVRPLSLVLREGPPADAWERAEGPRKRTCEVTLDCSANAGSYHPRGPQRSVQRRPHSHARVLMHERQGPAATCGSVVLRQADLPPPTQTDV